MAEFVNIISRLETIHFDQVIETAKSLIRLDMVFTAKNRVSGGIRLLNTEREVNDYAAAFGEIRQAKGKVILPHLLFSDFAESGLSIVDWECGQGLAASVTLDYTRRYHPSLKVLCVWLIGIVSLALRRAQSLDYYPCTGKLVAPEFFVELLPIPDERKNLKDKGQRKACGCIVSKDIGMYNTCPHLCRYCYANSSDELVERNYNAQCMGRNDI